MKIPKTSSGVEVNLATETCTDTVTDLTVLPTTMFTAPTSRLCGTAARVVQYDASEAQIRSVVGTTCGCRQSVSKLLFLSTHQSKYKILNNNIFIVIFDKLPNIA